MNKHVPKLGIVALLVAVIVGFQNCSEARFSAGGEGDAASNAGNFDFPDSNVTPHESIQTLQPALAIRGAGCVTCHAQVQSNIITDFGYGGDGMGRDYYFGQMAPSPIVWNSGAVYGDHGGAFRSLVMPSTAKIIVPRAPIPAAAQSAAGATMLAQYVRNQLAGSPTATTRGVVIEEAANSVRIGAPTAASLRTAFGWTPMAGSILYRPGKPTSFPLTGLVLGPNGLHVRNSGVVSCEGDTLINGTLYLENLQLRTRTGCRLYVTESVFISGPITYMQDAAADYSQRNLQISSARTIDVGLGDVYRSNNTHCETSGQWYFGQPTFRSSIAVRHRDIWTVPGQFLRENKPIAQQTADVLNDAQKVGQVIYDASCRPEGRNVAFERLLLNAPQVHSRYIGNVRGVIIAEYSLISLQNFKFEFDPIFQTVNTLPMLRAADILDVR